MLLAQYFLPEVAIEDFIYRVETVGAQYGNLLTVVFLQFLQGEEDGVSPRSRVKDIQAHLGHSELLDTR